MTSFGLMVALGALVGLWMLHREAHRSGLLPGADDVGVWGLVGGIIGAKLLFVAEHAREGDLSSLLLGRGGLSWFGAADDPPLGSRVPGGLPPTAARVHPTQLYEAVFLGALAFILVGGRKRGRSDAEVAGLYLVSVGAFRFLLEFIRVNPRAALGLTTAQWASVAVVVREHSFSCVRGVGAFSSPDPPRGSASITIPGSDPS